MKKKQMLALGLHRLAVTIVARGLSPLLPVYAIYLDADAQLVGYYMSFSLIALVTGNFLGGWIGDRFGHRKMLLPSTVASIPAIWLMGRVNDIWQLATLTAIVWCFYIGIGNNINLTLAGLFSQSKERGKVFGILSAAPALAGLLAGLTFGPIADLWGYSTMFKFVCLFSCTLAFLSKLLLEHKPLSNTRSPKNITKNSKEKWSKGFLLMLTATLIMGLVSFGGNLGLSLAMNQQGFLLRHISLVAALSASVSFLFSPLSGWLSDKFGRKPILISCYLIGALGIFLLTGAVSLWQFSLAACGISFLSYVAFGISSALVTDLVAPDFLGRGISLFRTALRVGGILGFTITGSLIDKMGISLIFTFEGLILIAAIALLIPIRTTNNFTVRAK